jgi:hypothetical protein
MTTLQAIETNVTAETVPTIVHQAAEPVARGAHAVAVLIGGAALGMIVSGFWNVRAVDGLGLAMFVTPVIGPFEGLSDSFAAHGYGFGLLFGVLAGLAATFTASNLASFALMPVVMLANERAAARQPLARLLAVMAVCVGVVGCVYGVFYGRLGPAGGAALHASPIRSAQSFTVFGAAGVLMLVWAAIEAGLAPRAIASIRSTLARPLPAAMLAGIVIGLFSIGRPLAVFRQAMLYAAQPEVIPYAALTGTLAALATLAGGSLLLTVTSLAFGVRIHARTKLRPRSARLFAAGALAAGGSFLLFYWCIARLWPAMGRWGFALGWYE